MDNFGLQAMGILEVEMLSLYESVLISCRRTKRRIGEGARALSVRATQGGGANSGRAIAQAEFIVRPLSLAWKPLAPHG